MKTSNNNKVLHLSLTDSLAGTFWFYNHTNHLGSIEKISDTYGQVADSMSYTPFGLRRSVTDWTRNDTATRFTDRGFTGQQHVDNFALINFNGRMYDPVLAHFLSPDPYIQNPENPLNYNRYSYCLFSPLQYVDPTGLLISEHIDKYGNIIAHYDDGDNSVYLHADGITKADIDKQRELNNNTGGDGIKIGELGDNIDISEIMENTLRQNAKIADKMNIVDYYYAVKQYGDWDLKNNLTTIFGVAWSQRKKHTTTFSFGKNIGMSSADVGNYHAGYMGRAAHIPHYLLWKGAGAAETYKEFKNQHYLNAIGRAYLLTRLSPFTSGDRVFDFIWNSKGMFDFDKSISNHF